LAEQDVARQEQAYNLRVSILTALEEKKKAFAHKSQGAKPEDVKRQRQERRRTRSDGANEKSMGEIDIFQADPPAVNAEVVKQQHNDTDMSSVPYFTTIPATPDDTPSTQTWFHPQPGETLFTNLESARASGVWTYPTNLVEQSRCATFRKLWQEGMYLGQGIKFGGEFLGYPGDPLRYHSHFVTTTMTSPDRVIRPLELVAFGRLGTATKKAHLLCCFDEEGVSSDEEEPLEDDAEVGQTASATEPDLAVNKRRKKGRVDCYSLEWGNFG
jgi:tRNA-splicing endonuclease subunit Sen34